MSLYCPKCKAAGPNLDWEFEEGPVARIKCRVCSWRSGIVVDGRWGALHNTQKEEPVPVAKQTLQLVQKTPRSNSLKGKPKTVVITWGDKISKSKKGKTPNMSPEGRENQKRSAMKYNVSKDQILAYIRENPAASSVETARALGVPRRVFVRAEFGGFPLLREQALT